MAALTPGSTVVEWNVIVDVQDYVSGVAVNSGWRLADSAEGTLLTASIEFHSREATAGRPQLVVTYAH